MGFHATVNAGTDQFGNMRHKIAPRVKASPRVTGTDQVRKFHALAGPVLADEADLDMSIRMELHVLRFQEALKDRARTPLTEPVTAFSRVTPTSYELQTHSIGGKIVTRKVARKDFTGWVAEHVLGGIRTPLASVQKGHSATVNGERYDCCVSALTTLQTLLIALEAPVEAIEVPPVPEPVAPGDAYGENYVLDILDGLDDDTQEYALDFMTDDLEDTLFLVIDGEKLEIVKVIGGYILNWG
jgi:hypothetical protein